MNVASIAACGVLSLLLGGAGCPAARAGGDLPVLELAATASTVDGTILFRPGDLLVGQPDLPGRPGVRPLAGEAPVTVPSDTTGFEDLGAACRRSVSGAMDATPRLLARGDLGADGQVEHAVVRRPEATAAPEVQVFRGEVLLARGWLPMPATPCGGLIAEPDEGHAPALLVTWTSTGALGTTVGVTVFRLPAEE